MHRYAIIIAAIPGAAVLPMLLAFWSSEAHLNLGVFQSFLDVFAIMSLAAIGFGAFAMVALLILAIITAFQIPEDPDTPTPRAKLAQIVLAVPTAAMPVIAFLGILFDPCNPDTQSCGTIFSPPIVTICGVIYVILWLPIATIWLLNKKKP